jgi:hypothetical protein
MHEPGAVLIFRAHRVEAVLLHTVAFEEDLDFDVLRFDALGVCRLGADIAGLAARRPDREREVGRALGSLLGIDPLGDQPRYVDHADQ